MAQILVQDSLQPPQPAVGPVPRPPLSRIPSSPGPGSGSAAAAARTGIVVFSGGSAANSLVDVFEGVRRASAATLSYVIPISDNGGSTSEIIRVFGGPGEFDVLSYHSLSLTSLLPSRIPLCPS